MGAKEHNKRITAIVPAYNEAKRISRVLNVLAAYPNFKEIIVIDDGSFDNTQEIVERYNVRYIKNKINKGKGYSMDLGVKLAKGDIIFFCDADVLGLTGRIIDEIIKPVLNNKVDMFIGMRNRKIYYLRYAMAFIPLLGGERALTKALWQKLPDYYKYYFRVEAGLNFYAKYYGQGFNYKVFRGLSQVIKEKKYGIFEGARQRCQLFFNLISAQLKLQIVDIPRSVKNRRKIITSSLRSLLGAVLGGLFFVAAYFGPKSFIYKIFAEELREDPGAPLIRSLLYLASIISANIIMIIGMFIFIINLLVFLLNLKKLLYLLNSLPARIKFGKVSGKKIMVND